MAIEKLPTEPLEGFFKQGYQSGLNWEDNYIPGGPWICKTKGDQYADLRERTRKENEAWMEGFKGALELNAKSPLGGLYKGEECPR